MSGHFKNTCECGIVLDQCRCASKDKTNNIISPCTHKNTEHSTLGQIEFRGWDYESSCWRYGYYVKREEVTLSPWGVTPEEIKENQKHFIIFDGFSDWSMMRPWCKANVDAASIGMWTGLGDKNGKRIYSGDILQLYGGHLAEIKWVEGDLLHVVGFIAEIFERSDREIIDTADVKTVRKEWGRAEVIDNLYEKKTSSEV